MDAAEQAYFRNAFKSGVRHRGDMHYEPLRVTLHLGAPVALTHPWVYLDSIIKHLMLVNALEDNFYLLPAKFPMGKILGHGGSLPIKHTSGLAHSSASIFEIKKDGMETIYKRFEDRWAGGRRKINIGSGHFRNYMMSTVYVSAPTCEFYVFGDKKLLSKILDSLVGIGDNTRIGWGHVRSFEIEQQQEDWSIIKDGRAMRPIPKKMLTSSSEYLRMAWRSPYWAADSVDVCAPPGAEVELRG